MTILETIRAQIQTAGTELRAYQPIAFDWVAHATEATEQFIPWLEGVAPRLRDYVQDVLNAPRLLRRMWATMRPGLNAAANDLTEFERLLSLDDILRDSVTGETVSSVVTRYLLDHAALLTLGANGRSDYPDLYLATSGRYDRLPTFGRKGKGSAPDDYGAALKGKQKRPVRVPDGLEIKTCRDRIAVDCHYPHVGLHLVVLFGETQRDYKVTDVLVAFLREANYRESGRNTNATTVKYSFNGDHFVSLLSSPGHAPTTPQPKPSSGKP